MATIRSNTWRKSQRLDAAVGEYISVTERFAVAYEEIATGAQKLIAMPEPPQKLGGS